MGAGPLLHPRQRAAFVRRRFASRRAARPLSQEPLIGAAAGSGSGPGHLSTGPEWHLCWGAWRQPWAAGHPLGPGAGAVVPAAPGPSRGAAAGMGHGGCTTPGSGCTDVGVLLEAFVKLVCAARARGLPVTGAVWGCVGFTQWCPIPPHTMGTPRCPCSSHSHPISLRARRRGWDPDGWALVSVAIPKTSSLSVTHRHRAAPLTRVPLVGLSAR